MSDVTDITKLLFQRKFEKKLNELRVMEEESGEGPKDVMPDIFANHVLSLDEKLQHLYMEAFEAFEAEHYKEAADLYGKIIQEDRNGTSLGMFADSLRLCNELDSSIIYYEKALEIEPQNYGFYFGAAQAYAQQLRSGDLGRGYDLLFCLDKAIEFASQQERLADMYSILTVYMAAMEEFCIVSTIEHNYDSPSEDFYLKATIMHSHQMYDYKRSYEKIAIEDKSINPRELGKNELVEYALENLRIYSEDIVKKPIAFSKKVLEGVKYDPYKWKTFMVELECDNMELEWDFDLDKQYEKFLDALEAEKLKTPDKK